MIATNMGKQLRMRRIFRGGKILVLPFDHPMYFGPQPGTESPAQLAALARDYGATAILLTAGALRAALAEVGDLGIILRIDATLSHRGGPDSIMHLLHSAEEAAALGADMVVLNCYFGMGDLPAESALLKKLAAISAECERIGMPLCGEIIPRVPQGDPAQTFPSSEDLALAIRLGLEYGCDLVKTVYNGDQEGYAQAVASGHLPVIMAGGPKCSDELAIFQQLYEAVTHGACGAAIGRRVWAGKHPHAVLQALHAIIFENASAQEAVAIYHQTCEKNK
jgi:DhnA family fructose-bisphosphate aldolase class Ia